MTESAVVIKSESATSFSSRPNFSAITNVLTAVGMAAKNTETLVGPDTWPNFFNIKKTKSGNTRSFKITGTARKEKGILWLLWDKKQPKANRATGEAVAASIASVFLKIISVLANSGAKLKIIPAIKLKIRGLVKNSFK